MKQSSNHLNNPLRHDKRAVDKEIVKQDKKNSKCQMRICESPFSLGPVIVRRKFCHVHVLSIQIGSTGSVEKGSTRSASFGLWKSNRDSLFYHGDIPRIITV